MIGAFADVPWMDTNLDASTRTSSDTNYLACVGLYFDFVILPHASDTFFIDLIADGRMSASVTVQSVPGGEMGAFIAALAAYVLVLCAFLPCSFVCLAFHFLRYQQIGGDVSTDDNVLTLLTSYINSYTSTFYTL